MKLIRMTITGVLCLGSTVLAQENADALKQRILTQAQSMSADDYAFTRTLRIDVSAARRKRQTVNVETYDPTKPLDSRWSLVSVNGAAPSAKALKRFRKEARKRRVAGYHHLAKFFDQAATQATDADGRKVFRFSELPKGSLMAIDHVLPGSAAADVIVQDGAEPFAEHVRVTFNPMSIKRLVRLECLDATSRYATGPDGKPMLIEQTAELAGSGFGLQGSVRAVAHYSDHRPVRTRR